MRVIRREQRGLQKRPFRFHVLAKKAEQFFERSFFSQEVAGEVSARTDRPAEGSREVWRRSVQTRELCDHLVERMGSFCTGHRLRSYGCSGWLTEQRQCTSRKSIARIQTENWREFVRFPLIPSLRKIDYSLNQCCTLNLSVCSLQSAGNRDSAVPSQIAPAASFHAAMVRLVFPIFPLETRAAFRLFDTEDMMRCNARRDSGDTLPR